MTAAAKLPLDAKAGIPQAWRIDLHGRGLTVYRNPGADAYGESLPAQDLSQLVLPTSLGSAMELSVLF